MKLSLKKKAVIALCIVGLSYTLLNVSVRMMEVSFSPLTQVYLRIGLGLLLTLLFFSRSIHYHKIKHISRRDWMILLVMGLFGYGLAVIFVTLGVLQTKLLNVAIIGSTTPFFVLFFSVMFLRKRISNLLLFFLLFSFYGVCVIATKSFFPVLTHFGLGELYVLLYAAGIGIYVLGRKFLSDKLNNSEIAAVVMGFAFITSLVCALVARETFSIASFFNPTAFFGLLLGGILNIIVIKLQNFGYQHLNEVTGSQLLLLENVYAPVIGLVLYQERILPIELIGTLTVLVGVWAYNQYSHD
jgi:drug/metabolite transporter (DMT)-like permease